MSPIQKTKSLLDNLPSWLKYATSVVSLIAALAGGIYAMEDRYVTDKEAAQSLQAFDTKVQQDLGKIELQILQGRLDSITSEYYKHKQLLRAYPEDNELKDEFEVLKDQRKSIKEKINEKMEIAQ